MRWANLFLLLCVFTPVAGPALAAEATETKEDPDTELLRKHNIGTDGTSLLSFLKRRSLSEADHRKMQGWIRQLGSQEFTEREEASRLLTERGPSALLYLQSARKDPDLEIARRAEWCIEAIKQGPGPSLPTSVLQVLMRNPVPGTMETLLGYLPYADDEAVAEDVLSAMVTLGSHAGHVDACLLAALSDPLPARRAGASFVLGRHPDREVRATVSPRLVDPEPRVRLRAAQGLLLGKEKSAIPALLILLTDAPPEVAALAEDTLQRVAGEDTPRVSLGDGSVSSRHACRASWASWWREHEVNLDLAHLVVAPPLLGLTVIAQMDTKRVWECGRDGKARWTLNNLQGPIDAQVLPGGRVLVAEFQGHQVTERDLQGKILWSKQVKSPVSVQRLPNGHTFIASYGGVMEVDREGKEIYNYTPGENGNIYAAQRLQNGRVVYVTLQGVVVEIECSTGRVLRSIQSETRNCYSVESLPGGRFLLTNYNENKVVEVDANGKIMWECSVPGAYHAARLPNGNTLVSSHGGRRVMEVNRQGLSVWEQPTDGHVWRIRRR